MPALVGLGPPLVTPMVKHRKPTPRHASPPAQGEPEPLENASEPEDEDVELLAGPQQVTAVAIAATGTGYAIGDTINLANGVVLEVMTLQTTSSLLSVIILTPGYTTAALPTNPVPQVSSDGGGHGGTFNLTWGAVPAGTVPNFPAFTPVFPPPVLGGTPPAFPPPSAVPVGPLVGPEVAPAAVPPSVAGITQPQFRTGSPTVPTGAGLFPQFITTPPYPPIVISGTFNNVTAAPGQTPPWVIHLPPTTPTVAILSLPAGDNETSDAGTVHRGHPEPAERQRRSVLQRPDARQEY